MLKRQMVHIIVKDLRATHPKPHWTMSLIEAEYRWWKQWTKKQLSPRCLAAIARTSVREGWR